jgi:hypothetical protein
MASMVVSKPRSEHWMPVSSSSHFGFDGLVELCSTLIRRGHPSDPWGEAHSPVVPRTVGLSLPLPKPTEGVLDEESRLAEHGEDSGGDVWVEAE